MEEHVHPKPWYTSKTIWTNAIVALSMFIPVITGGLGDLMSQEMALKLATVFGIANAGLQIVLRVFFTDSAIDGKPRPLIPILALLVLFGVFALPVSEASAHHGPLAPGWNNIVGTGDTPVEFHDGHQCATVFYEWVPEVQRWNHWFIGVPDYVNAVEPILVLEPDTAYWVFCETG